MKYVLNLAEDNRILSASFYNEFSPEDAIKVNELPEGNIADYKYVNGEFIHDPLPVIEIEEQPSELDKLDARLTYVEMMTGIMEV